MKTEQEQRRAIRQILFDANDICQATPCENEYCIYHGDYRCYDNVIVDKLIRAGYGDVSEYKAEIERLEDDYTKLQEQFAQYQMASDKEIMAQKKEAEKRFESNIRNDTAKEILDMLYDMGIDKETLECCRIFDVNGVSLAKQICEKYGVEIEEQ